MAGFEDLIRGALIKQENPSAEARAAVYQSARQALDRMTMNNAQLTPEMVVAQKRKLEQAVAEIEASYSGVVQSAPAPQSQQPPIPQSAPPPMTASRDPSPAAPQASPKPVRLEPDFGAEPPQPTSAQEPAYADNYTGDALKERKPYARLLIWTIILVGLGVAIWWAVTFGPALIKQQLDGSVPNPQPTIESGSFVPGEKDASGWVSVFSPEIGIDDVATNGTGAAELLRDGGRPILRMASPDGKPASNLLITVPREVMDSLKGEAATFEVVVRSTQADSQEFVLFCEFSEMGNCGRKRFTAGRNPEPFIFDVLVNNVLLPSGEDGYLSINTDFIGKGRPLDLYSIRVRTE